MKRIPMLIILWGLLFTLLNSLYGQKKISLVSNEFLISPMEALQDNKMIFISSDTSYVSPAILQTEDGNIWLVWRNDNDSQIYYKISSDNCNSWSPPYALSNSDDNLWPFITKTSDGRIWVLWTADKQCWDIFYRTTSDEGGKWSLIEKIKTPESYSTRPTMMETRDGKFWILWGNHCVTSIDKGISWSDVLNSPVISNRPIAFDLLFPIDNLWTNNRSPLFGWQASSDPDSGSIMYTLHVNRKVINVDKDSTQTLLDSLLSYGSHSWSIIAKDKDSLTTRSRQAFTLNVIPPIAIQFPDKRTTGRVVRGGETSYEVSVNNTTPVPAFFGLDVSENLKKPGIHYTLLPDTISLSAGQIAKSRLTVSVDTSYIMDSDLATHTFNIFTLGNDVRSADSTLIIEKIPMVHDLVPEDKAIMGSDNVTFSWYTYIESTSKIYLRSEDETGYREYHGDQGKLHSVTVSSLVRNKNYYFKAESSSRAGIYITPKESSFYVSSGIVFNKKIYDFKIKRDYNQTLTIDGQPIKIGVKNIDSNSHSLLLEVESPFPELPLGFVGKGSQDETIQLGPYESTEVSLVIHAQNVPVTGDVPYQDYSFLATLISEDEGDTLESSARINIHVKVPYIQFDIKEISSQYPSQFLSKRFRITNSPDGDPITDLTLHVSDDFKNVMITDPVIENVNLSSAKVIEFEIIPDLLYFLNNPSAPTSGILIFTAAGKEKSIRVDFNCPEGQYLWPNTLGNVIFTSKTTAGWCTNASPLYADFKLPPGINRENISKMNITMEFTPKSSNIKPHNTTIFLNDHEIYTLQKTVPSGAFRFDIDNDYLNYSDIGFATNKIKIGSTMNRGSTLIVSDIEIWIAIEEIKFVVCAPNEEKAMTIASEGLFKSEPTSYNVIITKPKSTHTVTIGEPTVIEAKLDKPISDLYVMATFSNGDESIRLKKKDHGKTYTGIWKPLHPGDRNGNFTITVTAGACGNGRDTRVLGSLPIVCPDIEDIKLSPTDWITDKSDPYQGKIQITIKNHDSDNNSPECQFNVRCIKVEDSDTLMSEVDSLLENNIISDRIKRLLIRNIPSLKPTADTSFTFDWGTKDWGKYRFIAETTIDTCSIQSLPLKKKQKCSTIYTIPKWDEDEIVITAKDTFNIKINRYKKIEVPIVAKVFFGQCSTKVDSIYYDNNSYPAAPLATVVERLNNNDSLRIILRGFVDGTISESDIKLAKDRSRAVKDTLLSLGVDSNQITIEEPTDPTQKAIVPKSEFHSSEDQKFIDQENRRVELSAYNEETSWLLFQPRTVKVNETINLQDTKLDTPMFRSNIVVSAPSIVDWYLKISDTMDNKTVTRLKDPSMEENSNIKGDSLIWRTIEGSTQFNRAFECYMVIIDSTDTERRIFRTPGSSIVLRELETVRMDQIFSLFKFDTTETIFQFYRDKRIVSIIDSMADLIESLPVMYKDFNIRFEGHGDVVGTYERNQELAKQRADTTQQQFLKVINDKISAEPNKHAYQRLQNAIKNAMIESYSNEQPLYLDISGKGNVLIGDNDTPIGRNLNRRVVIQLYQSPDYMIIQILQFLNGCVPILLGHR